MSNGGGRARLRRHVQQKQDDDSVEETKKMRIALASDFFCPNAGGVETHIYWLAQCLLAAGHHVIVLTHDYGERRGIRYLKNRLKVYYLPVIHMYNGCSAASIIGILPWFRWIFSHERIQIVHGHSTFSVLAHEALVTGWCMGLHTVFTDHSLFGFADSSAILMNNLVIRHTLANIGEAVAVSYTSKENLVLRASIDAQRVWVIPNAIATSLFVPEPELYSSQPTTIVFVGRLVYRKGADLLARIIPTICARFPAVGFVIGGDGPKRVDLEEMRERHNLHERVRMLGALPHSQVRDVLVQGQIFVNTSLTEAFCMSIVEAASCGLHVVSTAVGGVPEVLPPECVTLADPDADSLVSAIASVIHRYENGQLLDPVVQHERIQKSYQWPRVAERTLLVYRAAMDLQHPPSTDRLLRHWKAENGNGFSFLYMGMTMLLLFYLSLLDFFSPREKIPPPDDESPPVKKAAIHHHAR